VLLCAALCEKLEIIYDPPAQGECMQRESHCLWAPTVIAAILSLLAEVRGTIFWPKMLQRTSECLGEL